MQCPSRRCDDLQQLKEFVRIKVACLVGITRRLDLNIVEEKRKFYIRVIETINAELEEALITFESRALIEQQLKEVE